MFVRMDVEPVNGSFGLGAPGLACPGYCCGSGGGGGGGYWGGAGGICDSGGGGGSNYVLPGSTVLVSDQGGSIGSGKVTIQFLASDPEATPNVWPTTSPTLSVTNRSGALL